MPQRRFAEPVELGGIDRRAPRPLHIEPGQLGRARQATRMRRQDALLAPPHGFPPISLVIPAKAGIQSHRVRHSPWTPAFAGVTIDLTPALVTPHSSCKVIPSGKQRRARKSARAAPPRGGGRPPR